MTIQEFAQILRTRWKIVCGTLFIVVLGVLAYSMLAAPVYAASTRLFVATSEDWDGSQMNDGGHFAESRVVAYTKLLTGTTLAQRTISKLDLDMTPAQLQSEITATAPVNTVLVDVTVKDSSPTRARDIVNTLSSEFVAMAGNLETPSRGSRPNAEVIVQQRATTPEQPIAPQKKRNLMVAVALGALIGVILAVCRDRLDRTVRTADEAESATDVGVIGEIPVQPQLQPQQRLISFGGNHSAVAEAFRQLRINVQNLEIGDGPRVLVVASYGPGEGRTTTAINLALALAEADQTVVVVDGDFRHPRVASYFELDDQVGFSTVLAGDVALGEALRDTSFPRLTALTAGEVPPNPTELLESKAAKDILGELSRNFDYVIVDSPPAAMADAAILAENAQGVLLLARFGATTRNDLKHTADALRKAGVLVIGLVVTMTTRDRRNRVDERYFGGAREQRSANKK